MRFAVLFWMVGLSSAQTWVLQKSGSEASLRGVSAVSREVAWASGTGGTFLKTADGGKTWQAAVVPSAEKLDFRGVVAFDANRAVLMSAGEGAASAVYSTKDGGKTWTLVFNDPDAKGFFDAIAFDRKAPQYGALLGDPVDGFFALFMTKDGGQTWERRKLPPALQGEGAFAASNSSLAIRHCGAGDCEVWFATGGVGAARVFHYANRDHGWRVYNTPLRNDATGAGTFSLALTDGHDGMIVGGNYGKPGEAFENSAIIDNAVPGVKFRLPETPPRGYRSSVVYLEDTHMWLTAGPTGSEYSRDSGTHWTAFDDGPFNAIAGLSSDACWAVGPKGRIAKLDVTNPIRR